RKVIITEDTVRQALHLDDAESIDCLTNEEIFAELARIGAQVGDLSSHTTKYTSPALTQKVLANMRRVGKGFSRVDTLLFEGMLVPQQVVDDVAADDIDDVATDDIADDVTEPTPPLPTPAITPPPSQELPSISQEDASKQGGIIAKIVADQDVTLEEVAAVAKDAKLAKKGDDAQGRQEESQAQVYHINLEYADKFLGIQDDEPEPSELKEVIKVVTTTKLMTEVVTAAATIITAAPITAATITATPSAARRKKGVVIRDPKETATSSTIVHSEPPKSKDKRKGILVEEPKP
nr:hypothetical protein [Tanacetum cinerariifolium]